MDTTVNLTKLKELADELAAKLTVLEWGEKAAYNEDEGGVLIFTEDAQNSFNGHVDDIEAALCEAVGVEELTW